MDKMRFGYFLLRAVSLAFSASATAISGQVVVGASIFIPLGDLPGGGFGSEALGVDATGSVVVGSSAGSSSDAFIWTESTGITSIAPLGFSAAVSSDGLTVVGASINAPNTFTEPFKWTQAASLQFLGAPPSGPTSAADVSRNGEVIVGATILNGELEAFRWTMTSGYVGLGDLSSNGDDTSAATAVSENGEVIVGQSSGSGPARAFRWTTATDMVDLGDLPGGDVSAGATNVSADGSVVVGMSDSSTGTEAFRWSEDDGMEGLGFLAGFEFQSIATATTASGEAIVGLSGVGGALNTKAFLWTENGGLQPLQTILENQFGLADSLSGWLLTAALDISSNGQFIVGRGINPDGNTEAWLVRLDQPIFVPEPSTFCFLVAASLGLLAHRRILLHDFMAIAHNCK